MTDQQPNTQAHPKKAWYKRAWVWVLVIAAFAVIGVAASSNNDTTVTTSATTPSKSSMHARQPATIAHTGATIAIGGSKGLGVTLQQVIDPAQGDNSYTTADAGKRFVGIKVSIVNNGTAAFSDDANSNVTVIGSDNQSYTADFDSIAGCTNFSDGTYTLGVGASATGCVVFQIPNDVQVAKVQFTTNSGLSSMTGEWLVP